MQKESTLDVLPQKPLRFEHLKIIVLRVTFFWVEITKSITR
uniref:Uncharacterized protein n=1 Tax=Scophthalmus maximus TaxID=52904 RepID=A0A8D3CCQ0_SCOMX